MLPKEKSSVCLLAEAPSECLPDSCFASDHIPYWNLKLTHMLQLSLSGNTCISIICTINPSPSATAESTSTLLFTQCINKVVLKVERKEVVNTDALLKWYRKEIEELKKRLSEREGVDDALERKRRLSAQQHIDENKAMKELNGQIEQLTKLILMSQNVDETKGDNSWAGSPIKVNFDMLPYQVCSFLFWFSLTWAWMLTNVPIGCSCNKNFWLCIGS